MTSSFSGPSSSCSGDFDHHMNLPPCGLLHCQCSKRVTIAYFQLISLRNATGMYRIQKRVVGERTNIPNGNYELTFSSEIHSTLIVQVISIFAAVEAESHYLGKLFFCLFLMYKLRTYILPEDCWEG